MAELVTYYFNAYTTPVWTNPANMVDGSLTTYGSIAANATPQVLTGNDCPASDLGVITKVEIRAYGYADADDLLQLIAVFAGGDGDLNSAAPGVSPIWSAYYDITTDTNAPSPWTWAAVQALDVKVIRTSVAKGNTMYCAKVEIRVTYTPYPEAPTNFTSPSQTSTTINLTWTTGANSDKTLIRFKTGSYPTGIADGYQAYFDTGEAVTVEGWEDSIIQDSHNSSQPLYSGFWIRTGEVIQGFPASTITGISFYLCKLGSPTGTAYIRVRRNSDGTILGTLDTLDVSILTAEVVRYDFTGSIDNPTEQDLIFTVEYDGGDDSNNVVVRYQNTNVLANAYFVRYLVGWQSNSSWDTAIRIYYGGAYPPLQPATTYYFRAWGYSTPLDVYSTATADLTQATSGVPEVPSGTIYLVAATGKRTQLSTGATAIKVDPTTGRRGLDTSFPKYLVRESDGRLTAKSA